MKVITVSFEKSLVDYGKKAKWIGNPIRQDFLAHKLSRREAKQKFGLRSDKPILVQQATVAAKQGESVDITLGVKNLGSQKTDFSYTVKAVAGPDVDKANDFRKELAGLLNKYNAELEIDYKLGYSGIEELMLVFN